MPLYEYRCPENGQTLSVRHSMSEQLLTWGQLCQRLGIDHEDTPPESPIERRVSGGMLLLQRRTRGDGHTCSGGDCCA